MAIEAIKKYWPILFFLAASLPAQQMLGPGTQNFTGRISTGWNYYSKDASAAPELSSLTTYVSAQYRWFDENGQIHYRLAVDYYEKNAFASPGDGRFDHRYIVRQLYGAYGNENGQVRVGKVIPIDPTVDAYPVNGAAVEGYRLAGLKWSFFGGSINDFYGNSFLGTGYNYGGSVLWQRPIFQVGAGYTIEHRHSIDSRKIFMSSWYKPRPDLQLRSNNSFVENRGTLSYSRNQAVYKPFRDLSINAGYEYYDRTSTYIPPADTLTDPNRYFFSSKEQNFSGGLRFHAFRHPGVGDLTIALSAKKRFGNNDLVYASTEFLYQNFFFYEFQTGLSGSFTRNDWLDLGRVGLFLQKGFMEDRLVFNLNAADYFFNWRSSSAGRVRHLLSAGFDLDYRIARNFNAGFSFSEEFGNAFDPRSSAFVRLSYSIR